MIKKEDVFDREQMHAVRECKNKGGWNWTDMQLRWIDDTNKKKNENFIDETDYQQKKEKNR